MTKCKLQPKEKVQEEKKKAMLPHRQREATLPHWRPGKAVSTTLTKALITTLTTALKTAATKGRQAI
ncbi:MAG: hypothetical protein CMI13_07685 [Oleibacter sp.]|nr:hypothetical protein [Thalassolituus sp.]|tara:strand:- start:45 stop:245 length:201 start_codon:yes stop_codon:yes gene_type:complete